MREACEHKNFPSLSSIFKFPGYSLPTECMGSSRRNPKRIRTIRIKCMIWLATLSIEPQNPTKRFKKQEIDVVGLEPTKQLMHKTLNLTPLTTRIHV